MTITDHYNNNIAANDRLGRGGFVLCTAGQALLRVNGMEFTLTPGWAFNVNPLIRDYSLRPSPEFAKIPFVNPLSDYQQITDIIADSGLLLKFFARPCWQLAPDTIRLVYDRTAGINELIAGMDADPGPLKAFAERRIRLIRQETLLAVYSDYLRTFGSPESTPLNNQVVYRFIIDLHENVTAQRSVSWYAAKANMSVGHFSAIVRNTTGHSPAEWITLFTLNFAKTYLENTDKSIKEIASALNFPDQSTFGKYFKRNTGMSVTDYRKANRIDED